MTRVLAVDDEPSMFRGPRREPPRAAGYEVDTAATGEAALELAELHPPNAVILDLGLPGISGFDVIKDLRGWSDSPIIVLSARSDQADKVHALDVGADDYVTKPFGMDELLARLRAALRRTSVERGGLGRPDRRLHARLRCQDRASARIAMFGSRRPSGASSRYSSRARVSSSPTPSCCSRCGARTARDRDSTLRVHLGRIRHKLEPIPSRPQYFVTEVGLGYRFQSPEL